MKKSTLLLIRSMPILAILFAIVIFILAIFLFYYVMIAALVIGVVMWVVQWFRSRQGHHTHTTRTADESTFFIIQHVQNKEQTKKQNTGRIIEHDEQ